MSKEELKFKPLSEIAGALDKLKKGDLPSGPGAQNPKEKELQKEKVRQELIRQIGTEVSALISPRKEEAKKKAFRSENRDVRFDEALGKLSTAFFESVNE